MSTSQTSMRETRERAIEHKGGSKKSILEHEETNLRDKKSLQQSGEIDTSDAAHLFQQARTGSLTTRDKRELLAVIVFSSGVVLGVGILLQVIKRYPTLLLLLPIAAFIRAFPSVAAKTGVIVGFLMLCGTVLMHPVISLFVFSLSLAAYSASDEISRRKLLNTGVRLSGPLENTFLSTWDYLGGVFDRMRPMLHDLQIRLMNLLHRSKVELRSVTRRADKDISDLSGKVSAKTERVIAKIEEEAKKRDILPEKLFGERTSATTSKDKASSTAKTSKTGHAGESLEGTSFTERAMVNEYGDAVKPLPSTQYYANIVERGGPLETTGDIEHGSKGDVIDNVLHKASGGIHRSDYPSQSAGESRSEDYM